MADTRPTPPPFPTAEAAADPDAPALRVPGPAGDIEAVVEYAEGDAAPRPVVVVLCHPLPTEGGTMHNKVVTMSARAFRQLGATTVRFNFRGTGASEGGFDAGHGELDDLRAVVAWARAQRPGHELWLFGFSFGAYVALRGAAELGAKVLVTVAPPAGRDWDFELVTPPSVPWLVIQGEADEIVDPQAVYDWTESLPEPPEVVRMPEAGHFFHRRLIDLRGAIKAGVRQYLPPATAAANG
ncbi:alpha/beta hydrolase [Luteimonas pelagia]